MGRLIRSAQRRIDRDGENADHDRADEKEDSRPRTSIRIGVTGNFRIIGEAMTVAGVGWVSTHRSHSMAFADAACLRILPMGIEAPGDGKYVVPLQHTGDFSASATLRS